jgi:thiamine pyrophosphokinase
LRKEIVATDRVICADSGARHVRTLGVLPEKLIGDMDSIDEDTLSWITEQHVPIEVFPSEKDMTDSEICLRQIPVDSPVLLVCSLTGRPDHVLSNLLLAGRLAHEGYQISLTDGLTWVYPIVGPSCFRLDFTKWPTPDARNELAISLLPIWEDVIGVTTVGLHYPLIKQTLLPGSSFSVSNRVQKNAVQVGIDLEKGVLLVMVTLAV